MFDIGFWELSIIGVVALVVIGPDRLPGLARTAGKWFGKMNRFVSTVKDDIAKEIKNEDLQRILQEQQDLANEFKKVTTDAKNQVDSFDTTLGIDDLQKNNEDAKKQLTAEEKEAKKLKKKKKKQKKQQKALAEAQKEIAEKEAIAKADAANLESFQAILNNKTDSEMHSEESKQETEVTKV